MNIRVCIPFYSEFESAKETWRQLSHHRVSETVWFINGHNIYITPRQGTPTHTVRNHLIGDGKTSPVTDIDAFIFQDSDNIPSPKAVYRMLELIEKYKVVAMPYYPHGDNSHWQVAKSQPDVFGVLKQYYTNEDTGLKEVDLIGMGFTGIQSSVFKTLEYPWFRHPMVKLNGKQAELGEDWGFCSLCHDSRIEIVCDFDYPIEHVNRTQKSFNWRI